MMQIPGKTCEICEANVVIAPDGMWCDKCKSVFHTSCLTDAGLVCPKCQTQYTPPDETELLHAHGKSHHSAATRRSAHIGPMIEIIAGALFIISPIAILTIAFGMRFGGSSGGVVVAIIFALIFMAIGVTLVVDGEKNFKRGR